jgi:hypothetical protein
MKKVFKSIFNPDGKNMIPEKQNAIDYLILNNALEVVGIDSDTSDFLYAFTPKIKEVMPELYHEHMNSLNSEIMGLWEKGYLDVDFLQEDPMITITAKALIDSEIDKLDKQEQWSLQEIKRLMKRA